MKMQIIEKDGLEVSINIDKVTQIIGQNKPRIDYIVESIIKHFSSHKYIGSENVQENNVRLDEKDIGRQYFNVIYIKDMASLNNEIEYKKKSMLQEYMFSRIEDFDLSNSIVRFNHMLEEIACAIEKTFDDTNLKIDLNLKPFDLEELIKSCMQVEVLKSVDKITTTNKQKYFFLLDILTSIDQTMPKKRLIVFDNIDKNITSKEYIDFAHHCKEISLNHDFHFILISSLDEFVCIDEELIEAINVVNEIVFSVPSLETLRQYIERHYPHDRRFSRDEYIMYLSKAIGKVGLREIEFDLTSDIFVKLINTSEQIKLGRTKKPNVLEINYLFE